MSITVLRGRVLIASVAVAGAGLLLPSNLTAAATPQGQQEGVCQGDHLAAPGGSSVVVTAPAGMLISGYCVKAGSISQGDGPEYVTLDPPRASATITHSSGKNISHYVVYYVQASTTTTVVETTTSVADTTTTIAHTTTTVGGDSGTTTPTTVVGGDSGTTPPTTIVGGDTGTATPAQATTPAVLPATGPPNVPIVVTASVLAVGGMALLTVSRRRST